LTRGALTVCGGCEDDFEIGVSRRIGITKNPDLPLRFFVAGSPFVSRSVSRPLVPRILRAT
jgi:3-methyladenine DNA glycosylase Mpg